MGHLICHYKHTELAHLVNKVASRKRTTTLLLANVFVIEKYKYIWRNMMIIGKITNQNIGKIKIDTFPGKKMRVSPIEKANHSGPRIFEKPHLLAPAYKKGVSN